MATAPVSVMVRPGQIELEERPVPVPGPGQVLVEVSAVGVCGSDVHWFTEGRIGERAVDGPLVLGHEASGVVRALGPGADRLKVGDRIAMEPGDPLPAVPGLPPAASTTCALTSGSSPRRRWTGPSPATSCTKRISVTSLPDHVSDDAGALLEPLSVGIWSTWKAHIAVGDRVLVTGAGPIGLVVAAVARAAGAQEVVVTDTQAVRLPSATKMGATAVVDALKDGDSLADMGADVLIECSGSMQALDTGIRALRGGAGPWSSACPPRATRASPWPWSSGARSS